MRATGIDFGTGNSVLADWVGTAAGVFAEVGEGGAVPSDLVLGYDGVVAPDPSFLAHPPARSTVERAIKRRLISALEKNDDEAVTYLGHLATLRLKYIYDAYVAKADERVVKAVLTCPANTGQAYRSVLLDIGRQIGLPSVDIVDEPTAAAVHHGLSEVASQNERWMVIDWGCGTCDVSLIQRTRDSRDLRVVCVEGDNELGGLDMDRDLTEHLAKRFSFDGQTAQPYAVESIKKRLSNEEQVSVQMSLTTGRTVPVACSRAELEALIQSRLASAKALIDKALASAGWSEGGVERIIATGGPMLMPCVIRMVQAIAEEMGAELCGSEPLTSVALGAARLAEIKRVGGLVVTNRVAKSIGIRVADGRGGTDGYHRVIHRGEDRPVTRPVTLATSVDLQDVVEIEIREGDNTASAEANTLLARLNAVVRPENQGAIKVRLQIALSDAGAMEAYIEPIGDRNTVRDVQAVGVRVEKGQRDTATGELRTDDPVTEFKTQVLDCQSDPDNARLVYERLKIKYHPDRDPRRREHWNTRLAALDGAFAAYLADLETRMRASTSPNLPWDRPGDLAKLVVDEVLAHRLTHCLANGIGTDAQRALMPDLLRRYPDYRRVLASYLFGIKRNGVLQKMLAEDDRPHVGLVVLLQNIPETPILARHEVLKAAYRVNEAKVRELIADPSLDVEKLYDAVPRAAETAVNPITGGGFGGAPDIEVRLSGDDTQISGRGTFQAKERIKQVARSLGAKYEWDKEAKCWVIKGKHISLEDLYPHA